MHSLNQVYSSLSATRRYEVWFIRFHLPDHAGSWWLRYLLLNPGRTGCASHPLGMPVQVWATWFPPEGKPQSFIQGFPLEDLLLSPKGRSPLCFSVAGNVIEENACRGSLTVDGHEVSWDLRYTSTFATTLSNKGWIGFSRTPHSDAVFSGHISLDGRRCEGQPLGLGLQGHNCGYRHRRFWNWTHAFFPRSDAPPTTLEALTYDLPLGLVFRKAVLWHQGRRYLFSRLQEISLDRACLRWAFHATRSDGSQLDVAIDGRGPSLHLLPYLKTDCSGTLEVANNSRAGAVIQFSPQDGPAETLATLDGAVLEMGGQR